jgi:hypothetical protein
MCNRNAPNNFDSPRVTRMVTGMVICVFHVSVTLPGEKRRLKVIRIFALYHYRGLKNRKCKTQIATCTGPRLGFHRF